MKYEYSDNILYRLPLGHIESPRFIINSLGGFLKVMNREIEFSRDFQSFSSAKTTISLSSNEARYLRFEKNMLSYYVFSNQSLEINEFKRVFKKPTGYRHTEKVRLINKGEDSLTVSSVSTNDEHFELSDLDKPVELSSGEEISFDLSFKPIRFGFYNAKLIIKTSIPKHEMIELDLFGVRKKGRSYYKYIDGVRYDRMLLEIAYTLVAESHFQEIDHKHLSIIINNVWDAGYITTAEKRSLKYIWDNYDWSKGARRSFKARYGYVLNE
ncbi:hypothetical protein [Ekhidna sp. To15]|uniref:hypothetical protein n=1 Tax=Ekhidna sp. To15 TaxID=3395267 RepID=UPI003F51E90C